MTTIGSGYSVGSTQGYLNNKGVDGGFFGKDGFGFGDIVDAVNPLKNLPVVSNIYNSITETEPAAPAAKLAGGALYGGVIGFLVSLLGSVADETAGLNFSDRVVALFDNKENLEATTKYAAAQELGKTNPIEPVNNSQDNEDIRKFNVLKLSA